MNKQAFLSNKQAVLSMVKDWSQHLFEKADREGSSKGGHSFDHTQRVTGMTSVIAKMEGQDPFLPTLAALIHDVGRTVPDDQGSGHGQLSRQLSEDLINKLPISDADKEMVKNAIEDHPKLNKDVRNSWLVKILMDGDRMDMFGAVGPIRAAAHHNDLPLYSNTIISDTNEEDLKTIYQDFAFRIPAAYTHLWTTSAKKIAKPRIEFLKKFIEEYKNEMIFMHQSFENLNL